MLSCPQWARNGRKNFKLNHSARSYNVTVYHFHQILCSTVGHPGSYNNKTLILYDALIRSVNDGDIPNDFGFGSISFANLSPV